MYFFFLKVGHLGTSLFFTSSFLTIGDHLSKHPVSTLPEKKNPVPFFA